MIVIGGTNSTSATSNPLEGIAPVGSVAWLKPPPADDAPTALKKERASISVPVVQVHCDSCKGKDVIGIITQSAPRRKERSILESTNLGVCISGIATTGADSAGNFGPGIKLGVHVPRNQYLEDKGQIVRNWSSLRLMKAPKFQRNSGKTVFRSLGIRKRQQGQLVVFQSSMPMASGALRLEDASMLTFMVPRREDSAAAASFAAMFEPESFLIPQPGYFENENERVASDGIPNKESDVTEMWNATFKALENTWDKGFLLPAIEDVEKIFAALVRYVEVWCEDKFWSDEETEEDCTKTYIALGIQSIDDMYDWEWLARRELVDLEFLMAFFNACTTGWDEETPSLTVMPKSLLPNHDEDYRHNLRALVLLWCEVFAKYLIMNHGKRTELDYRMVFVLIQGLYALDKTRLVTTQDGSSEGSVVSY